MPIPMPISSREVWRDFTVDGVPSSGNHHPHKPSIRIWARWMEDVVSSFLSNGGLIYALLSDLNADLGRSPNSMAWVLGDPTVANNGIYMKLGASGAGSWRRMSDLPFSFIYASNAGTGSPDAIQATTDVPVSPSMMILLPIAEDYSGEGATVSFNGSLPIPIKTNSGEDVVRLAAGSVVYGVISAAAFRLASDEAIASLIYEARDVATDAATRAETARDIAAGYASDAVSQGNVPIYGTVQGLAALEIPAGINVIRLNGYAATNDNGGWVAIEVENSGPVQPWQRQSNAGTRRWEMVSNSPNVKMFGITGAGDESAALNTAIKYCADRRIRELEVPKGLVVRADGIVNNNGVLLTGSGVVNSGNVKYNARSDEHEPWIDGLEYLFVAHTILSTENSLHKTLLVGDSTVYGAYIGMSGDRLPTEYQPHNILYRLGIEYGAGWHQVINAGVNGTTVADLNTSLVTADNTISTLVIKYMVNDASFEPQGDAVETFANNLRAKLATIRAARGVGGANGLSIILVSGNSANSNGAVPARGNQWFEKAIPVLRRAARDFQCCFVDVYSPMRDNKNAGTWMDTTDAGSNHTHPGVMMQHWIWGMVADVLFNRNAMNRLTRPKPLTLSNGWGALSGYGAPHISRSGGVVTIQGVIAGGAVAVGTLITTLPFGSWPFADLIVPALTSAGSSCALKISSTTGQVTFLTAGSATWTSINFSYRIG